MLRSSAPLFVAAVLGLSPSLALGAPPEEIADTSPSTASQSDLEGAAAPDAAIEPASSGPVEASAGTEPATSDETQPDGGDEGDPDVEDDGGDGEDPTSEPLEASSVSEDTDDTAADEGDDPPHLPNPLPPKHRIAYNNLTVIRLNPLGLINRFLIDYRYRLYDEPSLLKNGSYIGMGVEAQLSPGLAIVRPMLTIQPAAVLRLRAAYGMFAHFGTFDLVQSYDTPYDEYYTAELAANGNDGAEENYANIGSQAQFGALIQAKVWQIAVRNEVNFFYNRMDLKGDDNLWYSQFDDMLLEKDGWLMTNDADLLWLSNFGLTVGVRDTVVLPFYQKSSFAPDQKVANPNGPTNRVGPLIAYTFWDDTVEHPRFNRPSILIISQWWTNHRYRTGGLLDDPYNRESVTVNPQTGEPEKIGSLGDSLPAMPYLVVGFAFEGDLFQKNGMAEVPMDRWKENWQARREKRRAKRAR